MFHELGQSLNKAVKTMNAQAALVDAFLQQFKDKATKPHTILLRSISNQISGLNPNKEAKMEEEKANRSHNPNTSQASKPPKARNGCIDQRHQMMPSPIPIMEDNMHMHVPLSDHHQHHPATTPSTPSHHQPSPPTTTMATPTS